jgi:hypothetical protein
LNYLVGEMTDAQGDGETVHRVITERLKDQHIERPLEYVDLGHITMSPE